MQTFTQLETKVYNLLVQNMRNNGILDTEEIAEALDLNTATVKGVLGSLTKKNMVDCEPAEHDRGAVVWPIHPTVGTGFWADYISDEDILSSLITENQE